MESGIILEVIIISSTLGRAFTIRSKTKCRSIINYVLLIF